MARINVVSQTGTGSSDWYVPDRHRDPFNIGFGAVVDGTVTYTIEHTFDDVTLPNSPAPTVFPHETLVAQTANADGNYAFPVAATRVTITAGTGTVTVNYMQAGIRGG